MQRHLSFCVRVFNIVKMAVLPKLTYRLNINFIKISAAFFFPAEVDQLILKFT